MRTVAPGVASLSPLGGDPWESPGRKGSHYSLRPGSLFFAKQPHNGFKEQRAWTLRRDSPPSSCWRS